MAAGGGEDEGSATANKIQTSRMDDCEFQRPITMVAAEVMPRAARMGGDGNRIRQAGLSE